MKPEKALQNRIMLDCGIHDVLAFHINPGKIRLPDGTWFDTGVPNGWPDITIFPGDSKVLFVEVKIKPNKPSSNQLKIISLLRSKGNIVAVIYTWEQWVDFSMMYIYI